MYFCTDLEESICKPHDKPIELRDRPLGLSNTGYSCYSNALMQSILCNDSLIKLIFSMENSMKVLEGNEYKNMTEFYFDQKKDLKNTKHAIDFLISIINKVNNEKVLPIQSFIINDYIEQTRCFGGIKGKEQDPHELMSSFFSPFRKFLEKTLKDIYFHSYIFHNLCAFQSTELICMNCKTSTGIKSEVECEYEIKLSDDRYTEEEQKSLEKLVNKFENYEEYRYMACSKCQGTKQTKDGLDGNNFKIPKDFDMNNAQAESGEPKGRLFQYGKEKDNTTYMIRQKKTSRIVRRPETIIITIIKYDSSGMTTSGMITEPIPLSLKLGDEGTWELKSVIKHLGARTEGGHYIAYTRYGDDWFLCNDETISKVNQYSEDFQSRIGEGYMYFYKKTYIR